MDVSVPHGAAILLDFVATPESRNSYTKIYGDHEKTLKFPITSLSIETLMGEQVDWARWWGSDAAGRYQAMRGTLADIVPHMGLPWATLFSPDVQDRIGYALLKRRGYAAWMAHQMTTVNFAKSLAEEWASLPVLGPTKGAHRMLATGDSYYHGDGLNAALVSPEQFEKALTLAQAAKA